MRIDALEVTPFVLGLPRFVAAWAARSPLAGTRLLDVLDDDSAPFFRLLTAGNALAFGAAAMPAWVQLDCVTLPSAMVGFCVDPADLPEAVRIGLGAALDGHPGPVPVAEFGGVLTPEPGTVMGFSLFSLLPGLRLGLRAKALALLLMDARRQIGVTRREGPVRRTHERLGPLRILRDRPAAHPHGEDSIVYELAVPPPEVLEVIVRTGRGPGQGQP